MEKRLRRYQNLLVTSGWGMIILGIYPLLQMIMLVFLMPDKYEVFMQEAGVEEGEKVIFTLFMLVVLLIELLFRALAGIGAIREGTGKKRSVSFIIFGILSFLYTLGYFYYFVISELPSLDMNIVVDLIISAFMLIINAQLLLAAFIVKATGKKIPAVSGLKHST